MAMDRRKLDQQAKVLRKKRLARTARKAEASVQDGVIKIDAKITKNTNLQNYSPPKPPSHVVKRHLSQPSNNVKKETTHPKSTIKANNGCSGCRRRNSKDG